MEKSTLNQGFDLEALIREKDFQELTFEERADVLSEISERESQQMRELVLWSGELLKETQPTLTPRNDIREKLNERFAEKKERNKIVRLLKTPVPVWQVAAATFALFLSIQVFNPNAWLNNSSSGQYNPIADSTNLDSAYKVGQHTSEDSVFSFPEDSF